MKVVYATTAHAGPKGAYGDVRGTVDCRQGLAGLMISEVDKFFRAGPVVMQVPWSSATGAVEQATSAAVDAAV